MDEVKKGLGTDEAVANETKEATGPAEEKQKEAGRPVEGPTLGVSPEGYFFIKAHLSVGYLALQGFLEEAKDWIRDQHKDSLKNGRRREEEEKDKKLIKPGGRFNLGLFKGK